MAIDRVLIQRFDLARSRPAIVDAIVHLSQCLRLRVTAVGIESASDLGFVREHRCDWAQGYYLGGPMSGIDFVHWYRHRSGPDETLTACH